MRYTITSGQLSHLRKEGLLEFHAIYPELKIETLRKLVDETQSETGRDVHRENPLLLSTLMPSMLGQIASQLFGSQRLKIAYTQKLPCYDGKASLEEVASVSEVIGGAIINLQTGDALVFLPQTQIDFSHFTNQFLVVFCTDGGRYTIQKRDPHTHWLKQLGYASGDRLEDETHPLIHK